MYDELHKSTTRNFALAFFFLFFERRFVAAAVFVPFFSKIMQLPVVVDSHLARAFDCQHESTMSSCEYILAYRISQRQEVSERKDSKFAFV